MTSHPENDHIPLDTETAAGFGTAWSPLSAITGTPANAGSDRLPLDPRICQVRALAGPAVRRDHPQPSPRKKKDLLSLRGCNPGPIPYRYRPPEPADFPVTPDRTGRPTPPHSACAAPPLHNLCTPKSKGAWQQGAHECFAILFQDRSGFSRHAPPARAGRGSMASRPGSAAADTAAALVEGADLHADPENVAANTLAALAAETSPM